MIRAPHLLPDLKRHGDSVRALSMSQYMRNKFEFIGLGSPLRKELIKEYLRESKQLSVVEIIEDVAFLWNDKYRESQYVATDLLIRNKKRLTPDHLNFIEFLITNKSWWDTVDAIASHIVGEIFKKIDDSRISYTRKWLQSDSIWLNRTCLLYQLKYGDKTNLELLYSYISEVKHKEDFFIQKAIGWSLRQASKFYSDEIRLFADKAGLSKLAYKEATKLLPR